MFNVISSVLGVSLMVGAGTGGLTYLMPVYHAAMVKAEVARDLEQGSQVQAAVMLRAFDGLGGQQASASADGDLVASGYLTALPPGWSVGPEGAVKALSGTEACVAMNDAVNGFAAPCPSCPQSASPNLPACLQDGAPVYRPA